MSLARCWNVFEVVRPQPGQEAGTAEVRLQMRVFVGRHTLVAHEGRGQMFTRLEPGVRELIGATERFYARLVRLERGWRPYTHGRWVYSDDHGWIWASDEPFGWATYHYGRWAWINNCGWVWIPGDQWAPAWVSWRRSNDYVDAFKTGAAQRYHFNAQLRQLLQYLCIQFVVDKYAYGMATGCEFNTVFIQSGFVVAKLHTGISPLAKTVAVILFRTEYGNFHGISPICCRTA